MHAGRAQRGAWWRDHRHRPAGMAVLLRWFDMAALVPGADAGIDLGGRVASACWR
jgi:hypothetical protein